MPQGLLPSMNFHDLYKNCELCPNLCRVNRAGGKTGRCRMDDRMRVARASLHAWEEPPLCGGKGSGTIFFVGCPMGCVYCQNRSISRGQGGESVNPEQLCAIMLKLEEIGAANINLVTATPFIPDLLYAIPEARRQGLKIPIVWNSSGYERVSAIRMLDGLINIYLPDFKYWDPEPAQRYSRVSHYRETAQKAVSEMFRQVGPPRFKQDGSMRSGMIVRQLLLPGYLEDARRISAYLFDAYGHSIYLSLMSQYTPMPGLEDYPELTERVSWDDYNRWLDDCVHLGIENAFIQEEEAASESFIPDFASWSCAGFLSQ